MRILIACEYSGVVREAFRARGHDAISCDLLPADDNSQHHYTGDVMDILHDSWDMVIAFPPCTDLAVSGAAWFAEKRKDGRQQASIDFFSLFPGIAPKWCIENPVGIMSTHYRKPDQIIHPWQFGHTEQKSTCLWLGGLPKLVQTDNVKEQMMLLPKSKRERLHYLPPSKDRWKLRSTTYTGIADAMAEQWSELL